MKKSALMSILVAILFSTQALMAQPEIKERNILTNEAETIHLADALAKGNAWSGISGYNDRAFWASIPANISRSYIEQAEKYLDYDWPVVKATDYLEFVRSGDRRQQIYAACSNALVSLVMGELAEGKGRFIDQIINAVWYYSEQTWWGWSAHLGPQKAGSGLPDVNDPIVDLGVGEVASNLSWTLYLFKDEFDKVHPLIAKRLQQEITEKVLHPYFIRDDFWYMGLKGGRPNNWNPWVNYNMLTCYLLLEDDPQRKTAAVQKILCSLDKFLNGYPDDGGCDEGPSYWGAAGAYLYECLEIMKNATNGAFDVYNDPLIKNIGQYFYQVNIHAPYFINFADADPKTGGEPSIVYRYGKAINDPVMQKFGAYLAELNQWGVKSMGGKIGAQLCNLKWIDEIRNAEKEEALVADFWFPDTEIAGGRDRKGSFGGFFFGAKGGFNAESHNHNDIGACLMYFDGKPCLVDAGRETYVAKTFSSRRYEIWTMQSGYHNLPVINGVDQKEGTAFKAKNTSFNATDGTVVFSTDIAGAYPDEAKVKSWVRSYTLKRGKSFTINDRYQLKEVSDKVTSSNLLTYCKASIAKPGMLRFEGDGFLLNMSYNAKIFRPEIEFIDITDRQLKRYWPNGLTRIRMILLQPKLAGDHSFTFTIASSFATEESMQSLIADRLDRSAEQYRLMAESLLSQPDKLPRSFEQDELITSNSAWWCSGFMPGTLWYLYQYTKDAKFLENAKIYTHRIEKEQYNVRTHDLGFMLYCSYGNGYRLTGDTVYRSILLTGAESLITRYNPTVGCIKSWNSNAKWQFPVIIDNMMNLEFLLWASKESGDPKFRDICLLHSDKTIRNHFRKDYSSYHVVSYDTISGQPEKKNTHQGFSDESAWSRGQAWGLYGYTLMYRETKIPAYLEQAKGIAGFILDHPNLPADKIPYWDFNAPDIPDAKRDASAGAIIASALLELSAYVEKELADKYIKTAERQIRTLSSPEYFAEKGTNGHFVLKHSVGHLMGKSEVDVPLTYADYYYIEALLRYRDLKLKGGDGS